MKKILLIILLFFVAVYFLLVYYFPNLEINKYDSIEAVQEQKAMAYGWVPKNLPLSAYDIVETHEMDSNTVFGKFSYKEKDEESFLAGLKKSDKMYKGDKFLFKVDKVANLVNFRSISNQDK